MPVKQNQDYIDNDFGASLWLNFDFELIEDKINQIDIDNVKELDPCNFGHNNIITQQELNIINKINELVQAVKQLNNKISSM